MSDVIESAVSGDMECGGSPPLFDGEARFAEWSERDLSRSLRSFHAK